MLRSTLLAAVVAGFAAGLVLTAVQRYEVVPIILEAETYERTTAAGHTTDTTADQAHADEAARHAHGDGEWAPLDGLERTFWTAIANIGAGVGFALLLCAAYAWRGRVELREGVLWGIGGFAVFFVNPAFGLAPEIPGAATAELGARQAWWIATVLCTAAGLALIVFRRSSTAALAGAALCLAPHVVGAPLPAAAGGNAPLALAHAFVGAAYVANAVFWVVLGLASAYCFARFTRAEHTDA
ncbi:MAG: CbtA family protein [Gammaproteobacteria bacterium]|nr:CbtA family protein [Gammaproteobacteria bacterium]